MQWNETLQTRFNELRQRELAGMLDEEEQEELAKLYAIIDADEEIYLGGAIERMGKIATTAQIESIMGAYPGAIMALCDDTCS